MISADGRYVVFHSGAADLTATPPDGDNAFLRDLHTGTTTMLSASAVTGQAEGASNSEIISPDGRFAAFATTSTGVVSLPTDETDVYVYNIQTGALSLASVNMAGTAGGNGGSGIGTFYDTPGGLTFSSNGEYLAFRSLATNLTPNVLTANRNLYVRNLDAGTTELVTPNLAGTDGGDGDSDVVSSAGLSANGQVIAFEDIGGNLVAGDNNGVQDVFVRDLSGQTTALASARSPLLPAAYPAALGANLATASVTGQQVSSDGQYVVFTSEVFYGDTTSDLAPGVPFSSTYTANHVFVRDTLTGVIQVVDLDLTGTAVGGYSPVISADGQYVAFVGSANLLPAGIAATGPGDLDIYVRDLASGTTTLVSVNAAGTKDAPVDAQSLAISADGQYVTWTSTDVSAVAGTVSESPGNDHLVFERDLATGTNYLVNHDYANDGQAGMPRTSA